MSAEQLESHAAVRKRDATLRTIACDDRSRQRRVQGARRRRSPRSRPISSRRSAATPTLVAAALDHLARLRGPSRSPSSMPPGAMAVAQEFRKHRRRRCRNARPRRAAMLLPRRPRAALARARAARAVPQGLRAPGRRLVAARPGQGEGGHAAARALATLAGQVAGSPALRPRRVTLRWQEQATICVSLKDSCHAGFYLRHRR